MADQLETTEQVRALHTRRGFLGSTAGALLAASSSGMLLSACGAAGEQSDSGKGGKVTFLTITPLSLSFTPELIAETEGYFKEEGLDVTIQPTRGSSQALQAVITGKALLTRGGTIETMIAITEKDVPLLNVGTILQGDTLRIVSTKRKPLRKPEDFEGKKVGIPSEGGTSETTVDLVVASAGIDPDKVQRQVVGLAPGVFDLVKRGKIDAFVVGIEAAETLRASDPDAVIFDPTTVITAGQGYLASKKGIRSKDGKATIEGYLRAVRKACDFVIADKSLDKTVESIKGKYDFPSLKEPEVAKAALRGVRGAWLAAGQENLLRTVESRWDKVYRDLVKADLVKGGQDPSKWFTNDLVPPA